VNRVDLNCTARATYLFLFHTLGGRGAGRRLCDRCRGDVTQGCADASWRDLEGQPFSVPQQFQRAGWIVISLLLATGDEDRHIRYIVAVANPHGATFGAKVTRFQKVPTIIVLTYAARVTIIVGDKPARFIEIGDLDSIAIPVNTLPLPGVSFLAVVTDEQQLSCSVF